MKKKICIGIVVAGLVAVWACGPRLPERFLLMSDVKRVMRMGSLGVDPLRGLPETGEKAYKSQAITEEEAAELIYDRNAKYVLTERRAVAEFAAAISGRGDLSEDARERMVAAFGGLRGLIRESRSGGGESVVLEMDEAFAALPAEMPREFIYYLEGAVAFAKGDEVKASEAWERVLGLPAAERKHRTVWATYMLGRVEANVDLKRAFFREVRERVDEGFADSLGLAVESLGWEARTYLDLGDYERAFELYHRSAESGFVFARTSLAVLANRLFEEEEDEPLKKGAGKEAFRRYINGYFLSRWNEGHSKEDRRLERWLAVLEELGSLDVEEAGRFAVLAYGNGDAEAAERWARLSDDEDWLARWIRSKLLLRAGESAAGKAMMEELEAEMRQMDGMEMEVPGLARRVGRELGVLRIEQGEFRESMRAFLDTGDWMDVAYIAENLMETEELIAMVSGLAAGGVESLEGRERGAYVALRPVLARRLMRENRGEEALAFFDEGLKEKARLYLEGVRKGFDFELDDRERAMGFWEAAKIARADGMRLMGTELFPDYKIWGGAFSGADEAAVRLRLAGLGEVTLGDAEMERLEALDEDRDRARLRFHYRYVAAQRAWNAASLLPNDEELTAEILATAGNWLKKRDPEAADRFYKALVIRCGRTELGQRARELNWLPDL